MNVRTVAGWVLSALGALVFAFAAYSKFTSNPLEVAAFVLFGLPLWFMFAVGIVEVAGIVLLLLTKWPLIGAALLALVGLGAAFEHLTHGQTPNALFPVVAAAFAIAGAALRGARLRLQRERV